MIVIQFTVSKKDAHACGKMQVLKTIWSFDCVDSFRPFCVDFL